MATTLLLKGSLFDEELLGALSVSQAPDVGDVLEHEGKGYSVTDVIREGADVYAPLLPELTPGDELVFVIVEPLAISQRRGGR